MGFIFVSVDPSCSNLETLWCLNLSRTCILGFCFLESITRVDSLCFLVPRRFWYIFLCQYQSYLGFIYLSTFFWTYNWNWEWEYRRPLCPVYHLDTGYSWSQLIFFKTSICLTVKSVHFYRHWSINVCRSYKWKIEIMPSVHYLPVTLLQG